MVTADLESEDGDEEDIDFEDEDFEGEMVFCLVSTYDYPISKQLFSGTALVSLIQMTKKTCLSTIWRRNLILLLPYQGHESREPYVMIIEALFRIEIMMQETELALRSIQSTYPLFSEF